MKADLQTIASSDVHNSQAEHGTLKKAKSANKNKLESAELDMTSDIY